MAERWQIELEEAGLDLQEVARDLRSMVGAANRVAAFSGGISGGGGFARLGGRAGAAAAALGALTVAATRAVRAMEGVAAVGRDIADVRLLGGGTAAQTAAVTTILAGIGISASEVTTLAARLRQNIAGGGLARQAASELGIGAVLPRGFGSTNDVQILNDVIDAIMRIGDEEKVRQLARRLEAPELTRILNMSREQVRQARLLVALQEQMFGPEAQRRLEQAAIAWQFLGKAVQLAVLGIIDYLLRLAGPFFGITGKSFMDALNQAVDQNTQATSANTAAINGMRQIFGGGERARGALPAGFRYEHLQRQMQNDSLKLGAFKL